MMSEVMRLQPVPERSGRISDGRKGCLLGHRDMPRKFLVRICGQFSTGGGRKVQEKNEDNRRRSEGMDRGENRFLGGSDPTLSGLAAAQRLRRRGRYRPSCPAEYLAPSPAELQAEHPTALNH